MFFAIVLGVLCALVMGVIFLWRGMPAAAAAAILWLCYALFELLQYVRLVCAGDCGVGLDLLLVWPLLVVVTLVALKHSWHLPASSDDRDDSDDQGY